MKKECFPILLDTKLTTGLWLRKDTNELSIGSKNTISYPPFIPQHLYICSNEEIKEGDWIVTQGGHLRQCTDRRPQGDKWVCLGANNLVLTSHCKKVIVTTDSSLKMGLNQCDGCQAGLPLIGNIHKDHQIMGIGCTKNRYVKSLPSIPQEFIQLYIKRYNEGKKIEKVMVKYEEVLKWEDALVGINKNISMSYGPFVREQLKLNGNEIIIHEIENKLFPLSVVKAAYAEGINKGRFGFDELPTPRLHFDNWIKQHI